jgi:lipid II:glycine glycyltransferase (peptidoglycan interpeptide bridge formation enzyme)
VFAAIEAFSAAAGVVSAFLRLSLFDDQRLDLPGERAERMMNVVRSLDLDDEALWYDYEHKVRKNVKRAQKNGLEVAFDTTGEHLDSFMKIYLATMERREAGEGFFFERTFFERIIEEMPQSFVFAHVRDGTGEIVSTELALLSSRHAYSFLGGTRSEAFAMRPNDLLKHELIRWLRDGGYEAFVLGGGYGEDDGIYRYKKAFAPTGGLLFRTQGLVLSRSAYDALVEERASWELARGNPWAPREGFFPAYRS